MERWTVQKLARAAGLTDGRIRQLLIDGTIQGEKYGSETGGIWIIDSEEAARFLESRREKHERK